MREVCVIAYRRGRLQFNIAFFKDLHNCLSNTFIHVVYLTTIFCGIERTNHIYIVSEVED